MPDQKNVVPTFVNTLAVHGFLNGVVNLTFTTAHWFPVEQDGAVSVGVVNPVTLDLRMDLATAQAAHEALGKIIKDQTKAKPETMN